MVRWILLLALTLAVGCDVTAPEPGDRIEDLMVTVDVVPYDVPSGLATAVIISVRNETDRTIVLEDRDCRTLDFVVYDSAELQPEHVLGPLQDVVRGGSAAARWGRPEPRQAIS